MIHAVYLANGEAHYRNHYVETKGQLRERKAGKRYTVVLHKILFKSRKKYRIQEILSAKNAHRITYLGSC